VSRYDKADVVFITDGQAEVEGKFLEEFLDLKKRKEFGVVSLLIQSGTKSTLERFSDAVVSVKEMLESEAGEVVGI